MQQSSAEPDGLEVGSDLTQMPALEQHLVAQFTTSHVTHITCHTSHITHTYHISHITHQIIYPTCHYMYSLASSLHICLPSPLPSLHPSPHLRLSNVVLCQSGSLAYQPAVVGGASRLVTRKYGAITVEEFLKERQTKTWRKRERPDWWRGGGGGCRRGGSEKGR